MGGLLSSSSAATHVPSYLRELFDMIFLDADTDGDGCLSTIELMHVLQRRAKVQYYTPEFFSSTFFSFFRFILLLNICLSLFLFKDTALNGNSHAIFTLRTILSEQADHG